MGSTFEGHMSDANDELLDEYGEQVTYTPKGGDATPVTASVGPESEDVTDDEQGETSVKERRITVPLAEIASPEIEDLITVGGQDWVVTGILNICSGIAELQCRSGGAKSKHHEQHKRKIG